MSTLTLIFVTYELLGPHHRASLTVRFKLPDVLSLQQSKSGTSIVFIFVVVSM